MKQRKFLCISIGILYLVFGLLKFIQGASPAEEVASKTVSTLTFGILNESVSLLILAFLETIIGLGLIFSSRKRFFVITAIVHMVFTFTPMIIFPELVFSHAPFGLTILGQYIFKNIVIIIALFSIITPEKQIELQRNHSYPPSP
ncbi:doxx family protein [Putridiphycobacter roseus]|uniref:Doxx family protein n=1 Tax=Putridiphycobacter roseus TaxID=2219161 RepID=A0A2W1NAD2_9FLAO|nr:doxx family protein [Putridiphycobacter roseus]PZE16255.1 doxx family protein [Putridiphycobacter roseus]